MVSLTYTSWKTISQVSIKTHVDILIAKHALKLSNHGLTGKEYVSYHIMIYVYLSIVVDKSPGSYFHLGIPWLVDNHSLGPI